MKIEVRNLSKFYKKKCALDDISLTMEEPKIYGLLGRNGAGKTTFMQLVAGLALPTKGEVLINGEEAFDNQRITESICFIKEGNNFKQDLKVKNVLTIASLFYPTWDQALAEQLVEVFALDHNKKVKALSKGMESALGIIVGLASKAPITMFDEPYIGLDAAARSKFYDLLRQQYEQEKRTFLLSTHLMDEVSLLFEEILIFNHGKVTIQEEADSLRAKCMSVSGPTEKVQQYIQNKQVLETKQLGGMMSAVVFSDPEAQLNTDGLQVEGVPFQQVMVHLTSANHGGVL